MDESKEPKTQPTRIDAELENVIVQTRQQLIKRDTPETRYAYHGALAIHQRLDQMGHEDKPHVSTIHRVLKRHNLVEHTRTCVDPTKPKIYYPELRATRPAQIYELDLVTPRYITGYGRIVSVNRVDIYSGQANLDQYPSKDADSIIEFVAEDWKIDGKPAFLKLDNEATSRGSLIHPRTFGKLTRFCLNFGVQIIFIPFNEPWRNPYIESFNSRFQEQLWLSQRFTDLHHLKTESRRFRDQHNHYQTYKKEHLSRPKMSSYTTTRLPHQFVFDPSIELPIRKGKLHFIRWVDEKRYVNVLNEPVCIGKHVSYEYVWVTVSTRDHVLTAFYQTTEGAIREVVKTMEYHLREPVKNPIPATAFCSV